MFIMNDIENYIDIMMFEIFDELSCTVPSVILRIQPSDT